MQFLGDCEPENSIRVIDSMGKILHNLPFRDYELLDIFREYCYKKELLDQLEFVVGVFQQAKHDIRDFQQLHIVSMENYVFHFFHTNREEFAKEKISFMK